MMQQISCKLFWDRLYQDYKRKAERYVVREDGAIYPEAYHQYMISPEEACREAYGLALAWRFSGDEDLGRMAKHFLDYAGRSLIYKDGLVYWPAPVANLCNMGRWARAAYRAAEILHYDSALVWLNDLFDSWPFDEKEHRFVERFMEASHYPTAINAFLTTYNMITEGVVCGWLIGDKVGNEALKARAKDVLCNFILPGQKEDGTWNYNADPGAGTALLNNGDEDYNYSLYVVYLLSNLLECEELRPILEGPVKKGLDALTDRFRNDDGSIYAPVHWGWDHIYESTLFTSVISWRLFHWCDKEEYGAAVARGVHWLMTADLGAGNLTKGISCVGLYWNTVFLDLLKEEFCAEGETASREEIVRTLERVERFLTVVPSDNAHQELYFSLQVYNTDYAMQRKIMRLKKEEEDVLRVPAHPARACADLPWQFPDTGYGGSMALAYDSEGLWLEMKCDGPMNRQPYEGASMFRGDGVILTLRDAAGNHALVNVTLREGEPVAYLYNDRIPLGGYLPGFVKSEPRGWYLPDTGITAEKTREGVTFRLKLLWKSLGLEAKRGDRLTGGAAITRCVPYGCQYNQWGRTDLEDRDFSYTGVFLLT